MILFKAKQERKVLADKLQDIAEQRQDTEEKLKNILLLNSKRATEYSDVEARVKRDNEVRTSPRPSQPTLVVLAASETRARMPSARE